MNVIPLLLCSVLAQTPAIIRVDRAAPNEGAYKPIYGYFGYDEPNFTYTKNGQKLIRELVNLSSSPVYIRTHFLLTSGDGTPGLKWGSTNAYTEDASSSKPVYDWTITDRIFDAYLEAGAKPFVEIGFMPKALSTTPEPYQPTWIPGAKNDQYYIGWSYPPRDFIKWGELVHQWVRHTVEKYGRKEVATWYWEVWNEPDIAYWHGTPEEFNKLYDYAVDGVRRALPEARVGGPATTGGGSKFLRQFLEHCSTGVNAATGKPGAPLDFITYHAKGRPTVVDGRVRMGISNNAKNVQQGFDVIRDFPKFQKLPIILSESDPEGCAACSARVYPQNAYRNGALYASYTAAMMKTIFELTDRAGMNMEGMLTWAFEFEDQPYFDGLRTLATNGIDKPVLNFFRMAGLMHGDRLKATSSSRTEVDGIVKYGVRGADPDIDAMAVGDKNQMSVLVWNYHDDDVPAADAAVSLQLLHLPEGRALLHHHRIDEAHSNAWTLWKKMGSPQQPTAQQYAELEAGGQLQELESPRWVGVVKGEYKLEFKLPRAGVSLIQLTF